MNKVDSLGLSLVLPVCPTLFLPRCLEGKTEQMLMAPAALASLQDSLGCWGGPGPRPRCWSSLTPSVHIIQRVQTGKLFYSACRKCQARRMEARACSITIIELLLAVLDAPFPRFGIVFWL